MQRPSPSDLLEYLIAFDTTSRESNLPLIEFVRDYLASWGVDSVTIPEPSGSKASLFATIGPPDVPGVILSGHTDVVPVDGQSWTSEPFHLDIRDERFYGRGTADMKGFLACVLAAVPGFAAAQLPVPVHLAFSYDEEVGCLGAPALIDALLERVARPRACIVGEPTGMDVVTGHKGKVAVACTVRGWETHSATPQYGVNAVEIAAEMVARARREAAGLREGPVDDAFDPPYSTLHTGTIHGGTALNIVPGACRFELELRHLPELDPQHVLRALETFADENLLPAMREVAPASAIEWQRVSSYPALETTDTGLVSLIRELSGGGQVRKVSFGTEAGLYQAAGIQTVVCGPGSIADAHKADEFVEMSQMEACERFLERLRGHLLREAAPDPEETPR
ncbi:MAG: acetylornithine deacetylase [Spiribacter salinus]|uniref:Acetylornithine deacetylase n=1 Tax=Spiribacter salinus TaxID=1335746 RepID=A0A540VRM3_9GAMM|nr:MAG: acetylornithine deacetylase [Spiribacter salinus]